MGMNQISLSDPDIVAERQHGFEYFAFLSTFDWTLCALEALLLAEVT